MTEMRDLYWLAGLLEGEGSFVFNKTKALTVVVWMTDRDIVERAAKILGAASAMTRKVTGDIMKQPQFGAQVSASRAAAWMMTLYPLMGERRRKKIKSCLEGWRSRKAYRLKRYQVNAHV